jgi:DNA polymerase III subunit delta
MAASSDQSSAPLMLICGDEEYTIKRRARQIFELWLQAPGGVDSEIIDAQAANSGEALKAIHQLREALQTLPFFNSHKAIWLQNCNFLGEDRVASSAAVTDTLAELAKELKAFAWQKTRLLISGGKADKRRVFYKTMEKAAVVEQHNGWSMEERDWAEKAEAWARQELRPTGKTISPEALGELVANAGASARLLGNEIEKLALYTGERHAIEPADVRAIVTRQKQARAFALGDALGDRNLLALLKTLDEELWEMKFDRQKSPIGILYGLIGKIRVLLFLKESVRAGWIKPDADYNRFKTQLENIDTRFLPQDKRLNPLLQHPFVLFKALSQTRHYTTAELAGAMEQLLECNRRLIFSDLDEGLVLQQTLTRIISHQETQKRLS